MTVNEHLWHDRAGAVADDLVTAEEAMQMLRVSQSTLWRWLRNGTLRAYRRGGRRIWFRRADLEGLLEPRLPVPVAPWDDADAGRALAAVTHAEDLHRTLLRRLGGAFVTSAVEDVYEARNSRSRERS